MTCVRFGNAIVCLAPEPIAFKRGRHWIRFEFDERFGPAMLDKKGQVINQGQEPKWWWDGFEFWWMNKQRTA